MNEVRGSRERLNANAKDLKKVGDLKLDDDRDENFINEPDDKANNLAHERNDDRQNTRQQLGEQVEDLAQKGKNVSLYDRGNEAEDELDEFEDDADNIGDELDNRVEIQDDTSDGLKDVVDRVTNELLDLPDGNLEKLLDVFEERLDNFHGNPNLEVCDFLDDLINIVNKTGEDRVQTLVVVGVTTPYVAPSGCAGIEIHGVPRYRSGCSRGEDTEGEEGDSGESERAHDKWIMNVGERERLGE